uniref:hypothetical protein n=1 Tax=Rosenbergiella epipactidis TaxID=1544694 RepID=UPI001F4EC196
MNNEINHNYQYSNKKEGLIFFLFYVLYAFKTLLLLIPLNDPLVDFTKNFINAFLLLIMGWALLYLNKKYWFLLFLFGCLFVISIVIKGNNGLYNYLVLIVILGLTRDISLKYILGVIISSNLIIFLLVLPFIFIAGKFYSIDIRYNQERFTLGFGSPNTMSQYLIMLYLSISSYVYKYLKGKGIYFVLSTVFFIIFSYIIYL